MSLNQYLLNFCELIFNPTATEGVSEQGGVSGYSAFYFFSSDKAASDSSYIHTSNKNIHFEMILDVGFDEKRKETRF